MKKSAKVITLSAALATGLVAIYAVAPSYAQDAATETVAQVERPGLGIMGAGPHNGGPMDVLQHMRGLFATFDTDEDGLVTQEEIDGVRAAELAEYDADGDGTLNLEEYQALWLARVYERMVDAFQELDADGDGEITIEEFNAGLANIVERLDQDDDGALGETDGEAVRERLQDREGNVRIMMQGPNGGAIGIQGPGGPGQR